MFYLVLQRFYTLNAIIGLLTGLKIVGGRRTDAGQFGAFITKVKKGSIADTVGHLRPGKRLVHYLTFPENLHRPLWDNLI